MLTEVVEVIVFLAPATKWLRDHTVVSSRLVWAESQCCRIYRMQWRPKAQ